MNNAVVDFRKYVKPTGRSPREISLKRRVFGAVDGLYKTFSPSHRKPMYILIDQVPGEGEDGFLNPVERVREWATLQEVIDGLFLEYPSLKPYATKSAIEAAQPKEEPAQEEFTNKYWECECAEDYLREQTVTVCPNCKILKQDGRGDARVQDVLAAGLPL